MIASLSTVRFALVNLLGLVLLSMPVLAQTIRIDELPRDRHKFSYFKLGSHVPNHAGHSQGSSNRKVKGLFKNCP